MSFELQYEESVFKQDIPKLSKRNKVIIRGAIEKKLLAEPEKFGKPLRQSLRGYRKLRVGDSRVIFRIEKNIVRVFLIQHRSIVYKYSKSRIVLS